MTGEQISATPIAASVIFCGIMESFSFSNAGSVRARQAPEYRAFENRRGAGVITIVRADNFTSRVEAGNRVALLVQHARAAVDLQAAKREYVRRNDRIRMKRRPVERMRPIGLGRRNSLRREPVQHERLVVAGAAGAVIAGDC